MPTELHKEHETKGREDHSYPPYLTRGTTFLDSWDLMDLERSRLWRRHSLVLSFPPKYYIALLALLASTHSGALDKFSHVFNRSILLAESFDDSTQRPIFLSVKPQRRWYLAQGQTLACASRSRPRPPIHNDTLTGIQIEMSDHATAFTSTPIP